MGKVPAIFHWRITATTVEPSCKEAAEAGTNSTLAPCNPSLEECNVDYFSGELFLNLSPSWIAAGSAGLLVR